jgi:hypothetical protein
MVKDFDIFIAEGKELSEGEQIVEVRDRETYEVNRVKAVVSRKPMEGFDRLWIWRYKSEVHKHRALREAQPWGIKIVGPAEEEKVEVVRRVPLKLGKGSILRSLLERQLAEESSKP